MSESHHNRERSRNRSLAAIAVLALALLAIVLAACSDDSSPGDRATATTATTATTTTRTAPGRAVTDEQALLLARTLQQNRADGGARFAASFDVGGEPVHANGRVDFSRGRGVVRVAPDDPQLSAPRTFYWTRDAVLAQARPGGRSYVRRAPDPQNDPIHAMIGFVHLLSAETIDNTANIRDQDARYLRAVTSGGRRYEVFRYGPTGAITLWVAPDGRLHRATTARVGDGLTVTLQTHEPVEVRLPPSWTG